MHTEDTTWITLRAAGELLGGLSVARMRDLVDEGKLVSRRSALGAREVLRSSVIVLAEERAARKPSTTTTTAKSA